MHSAAERRNEREKWVAIQKEGIRRQSAKLILSRHPDMF
jgi:hypothetical protein